MNPVNIVNHPPKKWMVSYIVIPKVPKIEHFVGANRYPYCHNSPFRNPLQDFLAQGCHIKDLLEQQKWVWSHQKCKTGKIVPPRNEDQGSLTQLQNLSPATSHLPGESDLLDTADDRVWRIDHPMFGVYPLWPIPNQWSAIDLYTSFAAAWIISVSPWGLEEPPKHSPHREASGKSWWLPSVKIMSTLVGITQNCQKPSKAPHHCL